MRATLDGRRFRGKRPVVIMADGLISYGGLVYEVSDFKFGATVNLDTTDVKPLCGYQQPETKQQKKKKRHKSLMAFLYHNAEECPDVWQLL